MNDDIIQICSGVLMMGVQYNVHEPLEGYWCPLEAEGEDPVLPVA